MLQKIDWYSMTSDELRERISQGFLPPIAGADDEGTAAEEGVDLGGIITDATNQEAAGEPAIVEEVAETPESTEAPEEAAEEQAETPEESEASVDALEQYNLALEIAADPSNEQWAIAAEILRETAPEAVLERYGLTDAQLEAALAEEEEQQGEYPHLNEDEITGNPEIDAAREEIRAFKAEREEEQTQAQQEAAQAAEEAAREALATDFKELAGTELPESMKELPPEQQLIGAALLGADAMIDAGHSDATNPKELVEKLMSEGIEAKIQSAIDEFAAGKGEWKPTPITERAASTNAGTVHTRDEGIATISDIVRAAAQPSNGISG